MDTNIDSKSNSYKFIIQGFMMAAAMAVANTSTVLPIIIHYFSGSNLLVGTFSALLRGGAIIMQLYAAFHAQSYSRVFPYLKRVFVFRFLSWFSLGLIIYFFSNYSNHLILMLLASGMFIFSFSAGFGAVYYQELLGKSFSKEYRGKVLAAKQFISGFAGILSGGISAYILENFPKPNSFAYLFMVSGIIMGTGFLILSSFKEDVKTNVSVKENKFSGFLKNSIVILKKDKHLRIQIWSRLIAYSFWLIIPFIILSAKERIGISGRDIGFIISMQMAGAMLSNILWGRLSGRSKNKLIVQLSFIMLIVGIIAAIFAQNIYYYYFIFFIIGGGIDGFRLAYGNLILIISPEDKRPVYIAIQNNITSIGIFFSIPGGILISSLGFDITAIFTIVLLLFGSIISFKMKKA